MKRIALINPNTSRATTSMMTDIARRVLPANVTVEGVTAAHGVSMILDDRQLDASVSGVIEMGMAASRLFDGIVISAFGDPGIEQLRVLTDVPVVGICEASMVEASAGARRFGIATITPDLVASFASKAQALGLDHLFTGTRLTKGDPETLAGDPVLLSNELAIAVEASFALDGAEAVIIGGGPLGQAAAELGRRFSAPVVAPVTAAIRLLLLRMESRFAPDCSTNP
ncbi:aspartate/glutamate racemase family protein [Rhizobium sullae]|uniref:Hydantoin racemase n=1 Tax=Rhizobium sullae TaxID=50338 RepID=A0A2N0DEG8_RHISU|nr:aspartate/glutamate racemase family protein [Rhizobium sullae]PKA44497.1 hydantoin racemase [Rhizobium sullae]